LLKDETSELFISERTYYNFIRQRRPDKSKDKTINGLLKAIHEQGFIHSLRLDFDEQGEGPDQRIVNRKLAQIFFYHPNAVHLAQRWDAGHAVVIDATFNKKYLRLPLMVAVGVTNENKTFPIAFSYCLSDSAECFNFFFEALRPSFINNIPEPTVVISDLAAGIISSFDTHKVMPHSKLQFCSWHVREAMKVKFKRAGRYTEEHTNGARDAQSSVIQKGLLRFAWEYVQSKTKVELKRNRTVLLNALQPVEKRYTNDYYIPKEHRIVVYYTNLLRNLGQSATIVLSRASRTVSTLLKLLQTLCAKINQIHLDLTTSKDRAKANKLTALDINVFRYFMGSVSLFAIQNVQEEWFEMNIKLQAKQELGDCVCELLTRYSLSYRHYLRSLWVSRPQFHSLFSIHVGGSLGLKSSKITGLLPLNQSTSLYATQNNKASFTSFKGLPQLGTGFM
jgi:MULE transposase domain